jgi:hypothetical protein
MSRRHYVVFSALVMVLPALAGLPAGAEKAVTGQFKSNFDNMNNISASDRVYNLDGALVLAGNYAKWLVYTGEAPGAYWRYTTSTPAGSWYSTSFDDSAWARGEAPFGKDFNTNLNPRTDWSTSDIWIRTSFYSRYDGTALSLVKLRFYHDEDVQIYLNGVQIFGASGYDSKYLEYVLSPSQASGLKKGQNTLAAHCWQNVFAQGIDAGLFACIADYGVRTGETAGQNWKYTTSAPGGGWNALGFDDSAWSTGAAPFGYDYNTNLNPRTAWNSPNIYIRRTFDFNSSNGATGGVLRYWHDEGVEVYLNGQQIFSEGGYTSAYAEKTLPMGSLPLLKGTNVLAAHCAQTIYACGIDVGLKLAGCEDEGNATTVAINAPAGERFHSLNWSRFALGGSAVRVSVLDASTLKPFEFLANLTSTDVDLASLTVTSLRLRFNLRNGGQPPELRSYAVSWEPDLPRLSRTVPNKSMTEDTNVSDLYDLGSYFEDDLFADGELEFTMEVQSEPSRVRAVISGLRLGFNLVSPDWWGTARFQINCSNGYHSVLSNVFNITVSPVNDPPVLSPVPHLYAPEDSAFSYRFGASDPDSALDPSERLVFSADTAWPPVTADGWLNITPDQPDVGEHAFNLTVSDRAGASATAEVLLTVNNTNDPPEEPAVLSPAQGAVIDEHQPVAFRASVRDDDGDALNITWLDGSGLTLGFGAEYITTSLKPGSYAVHFRASDGASSVESETVAFTVRNVNDPPADVRILAPANGSTVAEHAAVTFIGSASDPDGDAVNFTWQDVTGKVYGRGSTLTLSDLPPGTHLIFLVASDGTLSASSEPVALVVTNVNDPPGQLRILSPADRSAVNEHQPVVFRCEASDPDGDALNFTWKDSSGNVLGYGAEFNLSTLKPGNYTVRFEATDGKLTVLSGPATFQVVNVNDPPENVRITAPENGTSVKQGALVVFRASASDPDGDSLNYTWRDSAGNVLGFGAEMSTKRLRPGTASVTVEVSDGRLRTSSGPVVLTVKKAPAPAKGFIGGFEAALLLAGLAGACVAWGRASRRA